MHRLAVPNLLSGAIVVKIAVGGFGNGRVVGLKCGGA